jgi:hypothetical protein
MDFASLNSTLGDDARNLEAFDKLPAGDSRRAGLLVRVYDQLITAQRYADAAAARPFAQMNQRFDQSAQERPLPPGIQNPDMLRKANRSYVVTTTAKDIEVLAGAGDLDRARTLTGKLLVYDGSEATKTIVQQHLKRAGHPELLSSPTP